MGKGLVIEGNRHPTVRDVDDLIERKGSIEEAFDGAWAEEGAGGQITQINGQVRVTEKVAYGVFGQGKYLWLIVVDRRVPDHCVGFRADASGGVFRRNKFRDQWFVEHASLVERALQGWKNSKIGPPAPDHALVPVSRQVAPSDVECMRAERATSEHSRLMMAILCVFAVAVVMLGCMLYTEAAYRRADNRQTEIDFHQVGVNFRRVNNDTAVIRSRVESLEDLGEKHDTEIRRHATELIRHGRRIQALEEEKKKLPPPAIEGTPNKTQGNEVGFVQPNGGSNQILAWIGGIAIFILGVWLCMVRISDDYNAKRRYKRK
jgi:hypothetical protein